MYGVRIFVRSSPDEAANLLAIADQWAARTATSPLSDHLRLAVDAMVDDETAAVVTLHNSAADERAPLAYGICAPGAGGMICEAGVDPEVSNPEELLADVIVTTAQTCSSEESPFAEPAGEGLIWWFDGELVNQHLLSPWTASIDRRLYEMRRPRPADSAASSGGTQPDRVVTRAFVPGQDEAAWLQVNNRAFADHPEQGAWDRATLDRRLAEPWFDPAGFRLYEIDGELAAFCWTKIHHDREPTVGEIYVIAVDPAFHGRGLGRQLTIAGLDAIAAAGVSDAMLFVDADNTAAVNLYRSLGFDVDRTRTAYRIGRDTGAQTPPSAVNNER